MSFFALAGYVTVQAVFDLLTAANRIQHGRHRPGCDPSSSCPCSQVETAQRATPRLEQRGRRQSPDDAVYLFSAVLLIGLVLNAKVGWWWADPLAALVIAALAINEGREAWHGEHCCDDDVALHDRT